MLFVLETGGSATVDVRGLLLAFGSGCAFALDMTVTEHTAVRKMHFFRVTLYTAAVSAVIAFIYGFTVQGLSTQLQPKAVLYILIVSLSTMCIALPILKIGIVDLGGLESGILCTLEPIIGLIAGWLILGERITPMKWTGCTVILAAVVLMARASADDAGPKPIEKT